MAATDLRIRISADNRGTDAVLQRVRRDLQDVERQTNDTQEGFRRMADGLKNLAAGIGVASIARSFVTAANEWKKFESALTAVTGSSAGAARELEYIQQVAQRMGQDVGVTANAWISLSAAAKGTAVEGKVSRDIFEAISLAMAKLGKSSAETEGALLAIEQMISKGVVSAEELRGQLGERLPGAFQAAAEAMGVTTQELGKMLEQGTVLVEDLFPALARNLKETYDNGKAIGGLTSEWSRLKNALGDLAVEADKATDSTDLLAASLREASSLVGIFGQAFTAIRNAREGLGLQNFASDADKFNAAMEVLLEKRQAFDMLVARVAANQDSNFLGFYEGQLRRAAEELGVWTQKVAAMQNQVVTATKAQNELLAPKAVADIPKIEFKLDPKLDKVDPELATNITLALAKAAEEGINAGITSGFRTTERQAQLWAEEVKKWNGNVEMARKYVAPPGKSAHEEGKAVDVVIRGVVDEEEMRRQAKRIGEIFKEYGLISPVKTESFDNPNKGLIHIQLAEDQAKQTKTTQGLSAAQKEYNAALAEGARIYEATRTPVEALTIELEKLEGLRKSGALKDEETYYRAVAQAQADFIEGTQRLQAELERTMTPAQALEKVIIMLNAAYQSGKLTTDSYVQGVNEAQDAFAKSSAKLAGQADQVRTASVRMAEAGQEIGNSIAMAFEEAILQARSLQDVLKALLQDIARIILRKGVTEPLGNFLGDIFKNIFAELFADGGIMTSQGAMALPKFASGGIMTSQGAMALPRFAMGGVMTSAGPLPLKRYATGGIATTPQLALFGEGSMNEAYVPLPDGRSIPVSFKDQPTAAPSVTLDVTVNNLPGQAAQVTQDSQGGLTIEIVRAQLANDMQRGGVPWVTSMERRYGMTRGRG